MNTTKTYVNHEKRLQILEAMMLDLIEKTDGQVIDILELRYWYAKLQKEIDSINLNKNKYIYSKGHRKPLRRLALD